MAASVNPNLLRSFVEGVSDRDWSIYIRRLGGEKFQRISDDLGVSSVRVSQIYQAIDQIVDPKIEQMVVRLETLGRNPRGVYFVQSVSTNAPIKVGKSRDIIQRILQIQSHNGDELILRAVCLTDDEGVLEAELHRTFDEHRLRGEWFAPDTQILDWVTANALTIGVQVELVEALVDGAMAISDIRRMAA